jgi:hypothetical protein
LNIAISPILEICMKSKRLMQPNRIACMRRHVQFHSSLPVRRVSLQ